MYIAAVRARSFALRLLLLHAPDVVCLPMPSVDVHARRTYCCSHPVRKIPNIITYRLEMMLTL